MSLEVAEEWFTGCTYTRLAPAALSSVSGTDPIIQALQLMPFGEVTRALEAKMQRLLLLSTADDSLVLLQWSEGSCGFASGLGSLVLLDQIRLPFPVLHFLRKEPLSVSLSSQTADEANESGLRLFRAVPWEADSLVASLIIGENSRSSIDLSDSTTASGSSISDWKCDLERRRPQKSGHARAKERKNGLLLRHFPLYGIALVLSNGSRVLRSLDEVASQPRQNTTGHQESQLLAITPLPARSSVLASLRRFRDGSVKFCVEDGEGNYRVTKQLHLQSFLES
ncbi:hypothetical protein, conserved [Eimeria necatrix]|uniref:Uncharacterized protein n=1 Tax=Eimeria necatrix TaxID=51315 RepID=U6N040_9EIME|nr:hypothetical protein, conserved [Eimeria necatrix]CDJ68109.1 hypothetical protein, conserved [Eimeria necatrix]